MSGFTDDGTGFNSNETSKRRAKRMDATGRSVWVYEWIAGNIQEAGVKGRTQDEAKAAYRAAGIQDSTYTGSRNTAHRKHLVAVLADEVRGEQNVYIDPKFANDRTLITEPLEDTGHHRATTASGVTIPKTPEAVVYAARQVAHWAHAQRHAGLIVVAPDWEMIDALTAHVLGEPGD